MRLLITTCKSLQSKAREQTSRTVATPFFEDVRDQDVQFETKDSILILVCVEAKNKPKDPLETAKKIEALIGKTKTPLVIIPFIHLTTTPAAPKVAYMVIKELVARLDKKGYSTSLLQFGWHRTLRINTIGGQNAFEYLES